MNEKPQAGQAVLIALLIVLVVTVSMVRGHIVGFLIGQNLAGNAGTSLGQVQTVGAGKDVPCMNGATMAAPAGRLRFGM